MKNITILISAILFFLLTGCHNELDIQPNDKITAQELFNDPNGADALLATLYKDLPIEDYMFKPGTNDEDADGERSAGFNNPSGNIGGLWYACITDEALQSQWGEQDPNWVFRNNYIEDKGFKTNRKITQFKSIIPTLDISEDERNILIGEAAYLQAYVYFYLAQRWGGMPIIPTLQEYDPSSPDKLVVPRSTERDTWDFVLALCDTAAVYLPERRNDRRATKWAALALKSRAALVAASVAKFNHKASLSGEAVSKGLAGMTDEHANHFYAACISASLEIMDNSPHALYKPNPADRFEAEKNYRDLFMNPNSNGGESILVKGIAKEGSPLGSNLNMNVEPYQTNGDGRMSPALDLVDVFEDYRDLPGQRSEAPMITKANDDLSPTGFDSDADYIKVNQETPYNLFNGEAYGDPARAKDARMWASLILPGTQWKNTKIIMQGGFIKQDGSEVYRVDETAAGADGESYRSLGGTKEQVSGFWPAAGSHSMSGFLMKKMIREEDQPEYHKSTLDFIVFRYGEVLLNFAEAVLESGDPINLERAVQALNDIRKRAAHTNEIPLTRENVRKERLVELAFENLRVWDLRRWRVYHEMHTNYEKQILVPMLDLREEGKGEDGKQKLIFVRKTSAGASLNGPSNFSESEYYEPVPRNEVNQMIQNP